MDTRDLYKDLLPEAPLWFHECEKCKKIPCAAHIEACKKRMKEQDLPGSLWDWCGPFFQYQHFEQDHRGFPRRPHG
jgi:hypothetical protein